MTADNPKHVFRTPDDTLTPAEREFCAICGHNVRDRDVHMTVDESRSATSNP
jgi:hypothetical protein